MDPPKGAILAVRSRPSLIAVVLALTLTLLFAGAAQAEAPQVNTPASITGTAAVGQELTAHNGTWLYADGTSCQSECTMSHAVASVAPRPGGHRRRLSAASTPSSRPTPATAAAHGDDALKSTAMRATRDAWEWSRRLRPASEGLSDRAGLRPTTPSSTPRRRPHPRAPLSRSRRRRSLLRRPRHRRSRASRWSSSR